MGNFEVDATGNLRRADASPSELAPIFDVAEKAGTVTFSRKDVTDTGRFELRMLEERRAELVLLMDDADRKELAASGVPPPKPIPVAKQ